MAHSESLRGPAKERYKCKLLCLHGAVGDGEKENNLELLDPYRLRSDAWIDDATLWPPLEFPNIYCYLIDTPGEFTREKLKAFKSLEAYNYYSR